MDIEDMITAIKLIRENEGLAKGEKPSESRSGVIECPVCSADLCYIIASINGHITGKCSSDDCLGWMM